MPKDPVGHHVCRPTLRPMSDRTVEVCEAFDRARAWDRAARDQRIARDLDRLTRLTNTITASRNEGGPRRGRPAEAT